MQVEGCVAVALVLGSACGGQEQAKADLDGGDGRCVVLSNLASPVDEVASVDPRPMPSGGPIVDGTYVSTQVVNYGASDAGYGAKGFQETVLISNGLIHLVRDAPSLEPPHVVASATYVAAGSTMMLRYVCAPIAPGTEAKQTVPYTSAVVDGGGTSLLIFDTDRPQVVVTFARQ